MTEWFWPLVAGARRTVELAAVSWLIGLPLGLAAALLCQLRPPFRSWVRGGATAIAVIPALAVLFWLHYPVQYMLGVVWPPVVTVVALMVVYIALSSGSVLIEEMMRLERRFADVALVLGLSPTVFFKRVLLLGAIESGLPRLLSLAIVTVHMTMFASLIGVDELFRVTLQLNAQVLRPVQLFTLMAAFYAAVCLPLYLAATLLRRRLREESLDAP